MEKYYYLGLDLFTLAFPLLRSFEPRMQYWRKWPGLFTGIAVMATVFLIWDAIFTANGVWGFNPRYLTGPRFFHLPIEEWLFFLVVPYSCVFLYEVMRYFIRRDVLGSWVARPCHFGSVSEHIVAWCMIEKCPPGGGQNGLPKWGPPGAHTGCSTTNLPL